MGGMAQTFADRSGNGPLVPPWSLVPAWRPCYTGSRLIVPGAEGIEGAHAGHPSDHTDHTSHADGHGGFDGHGH